MQAESIAAQNQRAKMALDAASAKQAVKAQAEAKKATNLAKIGSWLGNEETRQKGIVALSMAGQIPVNPEDGSRKDASDILSLYDRFRTTLTDPDERDALMMNVGNKRAEDESFYAPVMEAYQGGDMAATTAAIAEAMASGRVTRDQVARYIQSVENADYWQSVRVIQVGSKKWNPSFPNHLQFIGPNVTGPTIIDLKAARDAGYMGW